MLVFCRMALPELDRAGSIERRRVRSSGRQDTEKKSEGAFLVLYDLKRESDSYVRWSPSSARFGADTGRILKSPPPDASLVDIPVICSFPVFPAVW
jgi:hypothetical protein